MGGITSFETKFFCSLVTPCGQLEARSLVGRIGSKKKNENMKTTLVSKTGKCACFVRGSLKIAVGPCELALLGCGYFSEQCFSLFKVFSP